MHYNLHYASPHSNIVAAAPVLAPGARPGDMQEYRNHHSDRTHHSSQEGVHGMEEDRPQIPLEHHPGDQGATFQVSDCQCLLWGGNYLLAESHFLG
jgi:hypothetical protein